ncbi:MAG: FliH/SctL family protein [Aminipila sp.]
MRKTSEAFQVQTSLEKAEKRLAEAIELAKMQSNEEHSESSAAQKAVEDAMIEFKKAAMEEQRNEAFKFNNGVKTIYGYTPEFSRHSKIENDITEIDEDQKKLVASILGEDVLPEDEDLLLDDENLLNEEFHDGYDSLNKIAAFNNALKLRSNRLTEDSLLDESEDYEMKCFNEKNIFDGETYEADDIMPSNFFLSSFDDEEEKEIEPYEINEALILGDVIPPDSISEDLEESLEDGNESLENIDEPLELDEQILEIKKNEIIEQARQEAEQQAEEILEKASIEAQKILEEAKEQAQRIIDEKVEQTLAEASEKGFTEGFEKGQNEGFIAAENAVNEGMIEEAKAFRGELELAIQEFTESKNEILQNNLNELTDLAINVAEKVIKISLKSSKDVVAKMIVAAAEDCRNKQWAKVYISHEDKAIAMNLEKDLIDALNQISANVKVVVMEDEPSGTCIIESPDQIVDASVSTQLDHIRQIASDSKI